MVVVLLLLIGILIDLNSNESIKIMINFLSNEIRADGLNIKVYKKICNQNSNCNTQLIKSNINNDIKLAVLKKAAQIKKQDGKSRAKDKNYTGGTSPTSKGEYKLSRYNFKLIEKKWQDYWDKIIL